MNEVEYMVNEVRRLVKERAYRIPASMYCLTQAEIKSALAMEAFLRNDQRGAYEAVTDCLIWQVLTDIEFTPTSLDDKVIDKQLTLDDLVKLNSDVANSLQFIQPYTFSIGVRQAIAILGITTVQRVEKHIKLL